MENINRQTEYPCSGCGACAAVCPNDAVRLEMDNAGLLAASVDAARCIECGLCVNVCSRFSNTIVGADLRETELFAVQSSDMETVKNCSSGGLAHELAIDAIRRGGKTVGAVYDTDTDRVYHEIVDTEEEVRKLDGSKYLQSDPQRAFSQMIRDSKQYPDASYTVFGTPCQIAGLAKASESLNIRDRFLLVEIFCHGIPPYKLWEYQMDRMRKKLRTSHFDSIRFRYKKDGWHSYCIRADAGGKSFFGIREREPFWHVYFENVLLGDACMTCRLRKETSLADLRIGDYWGKRYQSRTDGVSAAFACTQRGKEAIERMLAEGKLIAFDPGTPEEMLKAQNMEGYSEHALHNKAIYCLKNGDFRSTLRFYRHRLQFKQRLKHVVLKASAALPPALRSRLKSIIQYH